MRNLSNNERALENLSQASKSWTISMWCSRMERPGLLPLAAFHDLHCPMTSTLVAETPASNAQVTAPRLKERKLP